MTYRRYTSNGRPLTLVSRTMSPLDVRWEGNMPMEPSTTRDEKGLIAKVGTLKNQGDEGSCTSASGSKAREILALDGVELSMAFLYEEERIIDGDPYQDNGAQLRTTEQALLQYGVCPEADDPYTAKDFYINLTNKQKLDAAKYKIKQGFWCPTLGEIRAAIAYGVPVQIGIVVYPSFENAPVGGQMPDGLPRHRVPMPSADEQPLGGHALAAVFDNPVAKRIGGPNSWGEWGWWTLPYSFFESSATLMDARAYLA